MYRKAPTKFSPVSKKKLSITATMFIAIVDGAPKK